VYTLLFFLCYNKIKGDDLMLESKRLILRKVELKDVEDMFEYAKDEMVGPMAGWEPHKTIKDS